MSAQNPANLYTLGFGSKAENVEIPVIQNRDPAATDVKYPQGKRWINQINNSEWSLASFSTVAGIVSANWIETSNTGGSILSQLTSNAGISHPAAGNISILGASNEIATSAASSTLTISLSSSIVTPGSLTTTTSLTGGTGITATTGNITADAGDIIATLGDVVVSAGDINATLGSISAGASITAGSNLTATGGDITASAGDIIATLGNIDASAGSVSAGTTVTAGTGITATTGDITATAGDVVATNGNIVCSSLDNGLVFNIFPTGGTYPAILNANARVGRVKALGMNIAAGASITIQIGNLQIAGSSTVIMYSMWGATPGAIPLIQDVTNSPQLSQVVVYNAGSVAQTNDLYFDYILFN